MPDLTSQRKMYSVIDKEFLLQLSHDLQEEGESFVLKELIHRFLNTVPNQMRLISIAAENEDLMKIQYEAHALLGRAANLGAIAMIQICSELEMAGKAGSYVELRNIITRLHIEYERLALALEEFLKTIE